MRRRIHANIDSHLDDALINLTPLIDVVFVILIVFIVIAPMLELDQVALAPGNHHSTFEDISKIQENVVINIHVNADNSIWYNRQLVTIDRLSSLLTEAKLKYPGKKPTLFHDKRACFGTYQEIKNMVEKVGFEQMDVILKPT